jgi:hypothetical protein
VFASSLFYSGLPFRFLLKRNTTKTARKKPAVDVECTTIDKNYGSKQGALRLENILELLLPIGMPLVSYYGRRRLHL